MKKDFNIFGLYSKIIKGLNGYPKMSKSIIKSSIRVDMKPDEIKKIILNETDNYENPDESVIYQLMSSVSYYTIDEINELYEICKIKGKDWIKKKEKYSEQLIQICSIWNNIRGDFYED